MSAHDHSPFESPRFGDLADHNPRSKHGSTQELYGSSRIGLSRFEASIRWGSHKMLGDLGNRSLEFDPYLEFFLGVDIEVLFEIDGGEISCANELII